MITLLLLGCHGESSPPKDRLTAEELRDPQSCAECHPDHVRQWSGSMHAYASEDPLFRAMEARGQRETGGGLDTFCVQCHAPLAVSLGLVRTGADLDDLDPALKGVTCAFCHQVDQVLGTHNNPLWLANDLVLRGGIEDPVDNDAHASAWSPHQDRDEPESSAMCGSCHDIVTGHGAHIERTYAEWQDSLFAKPAIGLNCGECHMRGRDGLAAEADGVVLREVHDHGMPAVDLALTDWPEKDAQREAVQEFLDDTIDAYLCVGPTSGDTTLAVVTLENVAGGHFFPSGATADRRAWVELTAWQGETVLWSSGRWPGDRALDTVTDAEDPDLWRIWSTLLDLDGEKTHFFWDAADIERGPLLPVQTTLDPTDPAWIQTHQAKSYLVTGGVPDRITMAVKLRSFPLELVDELVASGDLDPSYRDAIPTFTLGPTALEWTVDVPVNNGSLACVPQAPPGSAP